MSTEPVQVPMFEVLMNRFREYRCFPLAAGCKKQTTPTSVLQLAAEKIGG